MKYINLLEIHNNSIRTTAKIVIIVLTFLYILTVVGVPLSLASPEISTKVYQEGDKLILETVDNTGKEIEEALIYKNNKLFARAFKSEVNNQLPTPDQGIVSFIFDDGWLDIFTDALPIFEKHGKTASAAVVTDYVDTKGALSAKHIRKLINKGWDISAHSVNDSSLLTLEREEQERNLKASKELLWKEFWATQNFIFPYGEFDKDLLEMTKKYYKTARGYEKGINKFPLNPFNLKIFSLEKNTRLSEVESVIDQVEAERGWLIFVGHHVSTHDGGEYSLGAEKYDQVLGYISNKNLQVFTYEEAVQKLVPGASLIKEGKLLWEIDPEGINPYDLIYVVVDNKRSKLIRL